MTEIPRLIIALHSISSPIPSFAWGCTFVFYMGIGHPWHGHVIKQDDICNFVLADIDILKVIHC